MVERVQLSEGLAVGKKHPVEGDLRQLAQDGFKSVVNLRASGEENQPLAPEEEGRVVRALGMKYVHYPVKSDELSAEMVDGFREQLSALPRPVFAHCASGKRSGAFLMMHIAAATGMTGEETIRKAEEMGFECDTPQLEQFVRTYVDEHRTGR
jgi:uncharacterized protein (TIGR01244 family)